jgi:hypothetical protein
MQAKLSRVVCLVFFFFVRATPRAPRTCSGEKERKQEHETIEVI